MSPWKLVDFNSLKDVGKENNQSFLTVCYSNKTTILKYFTQYQHKLNSQKQKSPAKITLKERVLSPGRMVMYSHFVYWVILQYKYILLTCFIKIHLGFLNILNINLHQT